jgi:hypothetical protein
MALFDTSGGLSGLLGDFGFGVPRNTGGLIGDEDRDAINKRALLSGGINAALTYLATPKNLNTGSALPYLGKAGLAGFNASQNTVDQALNTAYRNRILAGKDDNIRTIKQDRFEITQEKQPDGTYKEIGRSALDAPKEQKLNTDVIDVGGKKILINKDTGAPIQEYKVTGGGLGLKDIYGEPQKDLNGNLVYVPKVPGYPIRDMGGKPIAGNVQLADKKEPTESQANAFTYYSRMEEADKIIKDLNGKYDPYKINIKTSGKTALIPGGQDVANYFLSENDQKVEQAQRNFINAVLRRESGAVISPDEFSNANTQYFDQPNDKPGVLKQKAANRKTAIEGIKRAAGPSIRQSNQSGQSNVVNFEDLK